jgi:hypothetical protein
LTQYGCVVATHPARHFLALPDFTWELLHTNRTRCTMRD